MKINNNQNINFKKIKVNPIAGALGAQIDNIDLSENLPNEIISEIYKAIGTLKKNKTKTRPEQPDAKGVVNYISNVKPMLISAWRKESSEGSDEVNHRVSLSLKDFDDGQSKSVDTEKTIDTVGNNNPF